MILKLKKFTVSEIKTINKYQKNLSSLKMFRYLSTNKII